MQFTALALATLVSLAAAAPGATKKPSNGLTNTPVSQSVVDKWEADRKAWEQARAHGGLSKRVTAPECLTSNGSPNVDDVKMAANQLPGNGVACNVTNGSGTHCTQMAIWNTAAIAICGNNSNGQGVSCDRVKEYINGMIPDCSSGAGKIGAKQYLNEIPDISIVIYHS